MTPSTPTCLTGLFMANILALLLITTAHAEPDTCICRCSDYIEIVVAGTSPGALPPELSGIVEHCSGACAIAWVACDDWLLTAGAQLAKDRPAALPQPSDPRAQAPGPEPCLIVAPESGKVSDPPPSLAP